MNKYTGEQAFPRLDEIQNNDEAKYQRAQETLGLKISAPQGDQNVLNIKGSEDGMRAIFREMVDKLGNRQFDHEVEENWRYIREGNHLRPGGNYSVTIHDHEELIMVGMNANARDFEPFVTDMHDAVKESVINAAASMTSE